ncbi:MAG: SulP family inorganic anion transporter [Acidobacteria bacterium]|nr:SulP family inorganic anion transporter [Acidobacteriota bacterium]
MTGEPPGRGLQAGLASNAALRKAFTVLTVGFVSGISLIIGEVALVSLAFSGQLAPYLSQGIGLILFGTAAACVVTGLRSGFAGAAAGPTMATMIALGVIGGSLTATRDELLPTMVAIIVVGSVATAACALLIERFRLANLVRFFPYPVSSGFVAGTGGLACVVALRLMGVRLEAEALASLFDPLVVTNWGVGVAYGLGLYFASRRWPSPLLMPGSFIAGTGLLHFGMARFGVSTQEAQDRGLLFAGISGSDLWPPMALDDAARIDWSAVGPQIPNILVLILVTLLCTALYIGGIELASGRELDWNREFGAVGLGSLAAGLGGAPPGTYVVPTSLRNLMLGAGLKSTSIAVAVVTASPLIFGDVLLTLVPVPLMGGVLLFTGVALLDQWLLKVRKRLPLSDYAIILVIFVTILALGFLEGVAIGMLITILFFVVRLSRVDVVDATFSLRDERSHRVRPIPDRAILRAEGSRVRGYRLRGYIFFGAGYPLADRLQGSLGEEPRPVCIVLDFKAVSGLDFSTVSAMCRFILAARRAGTRVVMSRAPATLEKELQRNLPPPVFGSVVFAPDDDQALEHCEDVLISSYEPPDDAEGGEPSLLETVGADMERHLDRQVLFEELVGDLRDWLDTREHAEGETLLAAGESNDTLQLITAGRASVFDAAGARSRQLGPGDAVEPRAPVAAPTAAAAVVADEPCTTATLTASALRLLEESDPKLTAKLYRYLLNAGARTAD